MITGIVTNQELKITQPTIVAKTIDYIEAKFVFKSDDWDDMSKWAHFTCGDVSYSVELDDDNMVTKDDHLNLTTGTWNVSLHGTSKSGTTRITTEQVNIIVKSAGHLCGEEPLGIPLSVGEQILQTAETAKDTAEAAKDAVEELQEAAENGEFKGEKGDKGDKGDDGADAYEIAVENGYLGTEAEWLESLKGEKGDDGASAYEVAVENGYSGTETEWLESLKGEKGDKGDTGATGAAGTDGKDGEDGADGVTPNITATATVDETTGTPTVDVTKSGTDAEPTFNFNFSGVKGEKGDTGENGADSYVPDADTFEEKLEPYLTETLENADSQMKSYLAERFYPILDAETNVTDSTYPYGNAKRYGAIGDGETDDTTAIYNTIISAFATGAKIYFPAGTYRIGAMSSIYNKSNIEMYGDGQGKTIFKAIDGLTSGKQMFCWYNLTYGVFHDFTVDGNSDVNTDGNDIDGIHMFDTVTSSHLEFYRITFQNNIYTSSRYIGDSDLYIHDCITTNTDVGLPIMGSTAAVENIRIEGNYIDGHKDSEGIWVYNEKGIKNVVIRDNIIQNKTKGMGICVGAPNTTTGEYPEYLENVLIDNNKINKMAVGICVANANGCENINITNNVITNCQSGNGMNLFYLNKGVVSGNKIDTTYGDGICLTNSTYVYVTNNDIRNFNSAAQTGNIPAFLCDNISNCNFDSNTIQQEIADAQCQTLIFVDTNTKNRFTNINLLSYDSNTEKGSIYCSSSDARSTTTDNYIEVNYNGRIVLVTTFDLTSNTVIVNDYTYTRTNTLELYTYAFNTNILLNITQSDFDFAPKWAVLQEGAKRFVKIVATYAFTATSTDYVTFSADEEKEAGTYLVELQVVDGHWYEMLFKKIA